MVHAPPLVGAIVHPPKWARHIACSYHSQQMERAGMAGPDGWTGPPGASGWRGEVMAMERGREQGMEQRTVRACLIINPKSGRGGVDLSEALTVLRAHGWE